MKYLKQYRIQFSGLKNGSHDFDFEIDKRFFDEYEYSLVKQGKLKVHVQLEKSDTMLILTFLIEGTVELDCDLCLNEYPENLIINERLFVKFDSDESIADASEEIIVLSKNDYEIDISTLLYEYINSSLPINNRCEDRKAIIL